jgi:hypothetical protein
LYPAIIHPKKQIQLLILTPKKTGGKFNLDKMQLGDEWINNMQPLKVNGTVVELQPYQACIVKLKN